MGAENAGQEGEKHPLYDYLRFDNFPHIYCPGCGIPIVLGSVLRAVDRLVKQGSLRKEDVVLVSGIGCAARAATQVKLNSFHTLHGRALAFATGVKLANPKLKVIVFSGDGDLLSIGGNHLLHAAIRKLPVTVVCLNNMIYGMTGGQSSPTTPNRVKTATSPEGAHRPLDLMRLMQGLNVNHLARWGALQADSVESTLLKFLQLEEFSFVEVVTPCPTQFGKFVGKKDASELLRFIMQNADKLGEF
jgi:2-oxoglutarate ferredoxin oxidoreductase subunit beta